MERKLREEIVAEVQKAVEVAMVKAGERWLTADELCSSSGCSQKTGWRSTATCCHGSG